MYELRHATLVVLLVSGTAPENCQQVTFPTSSWLTIEDMRRIPELYFRKYKIVERLCRVARAM